VDAKWIPIFAAAVGVLGGVGGAIVGGSLANAAEETRLESEREAAIVDLRRATYAKWVGAADAYAFTNLAAAELFTEGEEVEAVKFVAPQLLDFFTADAAVDLIAKTALADATDEMEEKLGEGPVDEETYNMLRNRFIQLAREEIESGD